MSTEDTKLEQFIKKTFERYVLDTEYFSFFNLDKLTSSCAKFTKCVYDSYEMDLWNGNYDYEGYDSKLLEETITLIFDEELCDLDRILTNLFEEGVIMKYTKIGICELFVLMYEEYKIIEEIKEHTNLCEDVIQIIIEFLLTGASGTNQPLCWREHPGID